ncbi:MAG: alpha/beta hydrolase [Mycobacterium sp.]|jgi:pimeloyl-ACP methyl ester carboxylesterase|uniref:alpha/beta fold hydrolase n=1 Tax=Mycobacterium sp. TaxID=1785 RepID=UPI000CBCC599|nr:alpha/beta hydrolase [Mycobacterium sp.]MBI2698801.1 alpha/beta hydrolase [Mycobacterium sp.]PJE09435.1 MAG: alpha/beta hydrolase [Mycobacterium sp.]PJE14057.1 MAG: alpha/beta hydrolase [Mycobacterium sp.]
MTDEFVATGLGRLHVQRQGSGPVTVLWHSLFLDSRSWAPLVDALGEVAPRRTVVAVDGPSHGRSAPVTRDFTFDECAQAAGEVLDGLGIDEPVDWVGNAWGGHIGILLAATQPRRIRTLATIGTPVHAVDWRFRVTKGWPLVALYRLFGPTRVISDPLSRALLGPDGSAEVMESFRQADRTGMYHAARSMMLKRPDLHDRLPHIAAPTLMLAAHDDDEGWPPDQARAACATMRNAHADVVMGGGRVAPLLVDAKTIAGTLVDFWDAQRPA